MKTPHADLIRLHPLAGCWSGTEVMVPNAQQPDGDNFSSTTRGAVEANGFVVTTCTEQHADGELTFAGHGVFWHDEATDEVKLHSWDLFGAAPDAFVGGWTEDRLVLVCENAMGHWRYTFALVDDTFIQMMEQSEDGETWSKLSRGEHRRD